MLPALSTILLILFIPICILLILIVLLQAGKGGGLAGAFGGGGGQAFLGTRGAADFLSKLTIYLAIGFMLFALILSLTYGTGRGGSRINIEPAEVVPPPPANDASAGQSDASGDTTPSQPASTDEGSETTSTETDQ